ncbi:hypothetical protein BB561_001769 [Smittium simulii]|uniref:Uncharacterized protein n=1 Tax=Smittium simulii TaxID=133385 RepID=A0A2T9YT54_9FUNG|nr:hypothetical protein BB561_001769 [Smittium simulii]
MPTGYHNSFISHHSENKYFPTTQIVQEPNLFSTDNISTPTNNTTNPESIPPFSANPLIFYKQWRCVFEAMLFELDQTFLKRNIQLSAFFSSDKTYFSAQKHNTPFQTQSEFYSKYPFSIQPPFSLDYNQNLEPTNPVAEAFQSKKKRKISLDNINFSETDLQPENSSMLPNSVMGFQSTRNSETIKKFRLEQDLFDNQTLHSFTPNFEKAQLQYHAQRQLNFYRQTKVSLFQNLVNKLESISTNNTSVSYINSSQSYKNEQISDYHQKLYCSQSNTSIGMTSQPKHFELLEKINAYAEALKPILLDFNHFFFTTTCVVDSSLENHSINAEPQFFSNCRLNSNTSANTFSNFGNNSNLNQNFHETSSFRLNLQSNYTQTSLSNLQSNSNSIPSSSKPEKQFCITDTAYQKIFLIYESTASLLELTMSIYERCSHNASALERYKLSFVELNLFVVEVVVCCSIATQFIQSLACFRELRMIFARFDTTHFRISLFRLSSAVVQWVLSLYNGPDPTYDSSIDAKKFRSSDLKFLQSFELLTSLIKALVDLDINFEFVLNNSFSISDSNLETSDLDGIEYASFEFKSVFDGFSALVLEYSLTYTQLLAKNFPHKINDYSHTTPVYPRNINSNNNSNIVSNGTFTPNNSASANVSSNINEFSFLPFIARNNNQQSMMFLLFYKNYIEFLKNFDEQLAFSFRFDVNMSSTPSSNSSADLKSYTDMAKYGYQGKENFSQSANFTPTLIGSPISHYHQKQTLFSDETSNDYQRQCYTNTKPLLHLDSCIDNNSLEYITTYYQNSTQMKKRFEYHKKFASL